MGKPIRRVRVHRKLLQLTIPLMSLLLLISACGQKGPLHLPAEETSEKPAETQKP
ncbi:MAG: lipoprotein [Candidatus Thiodiazotropha sp.]